MVCLPSCARFVTTVVFFTGKVLPDRDRVPLSGQGKCSRSRQQAAALQGEPEEEEGEEGEEAPEEGRGMQPPWPHLLHPRQQPLADGPVLEP